MNTDPVIIALEQQVGCYEQLAKLAEIQHEYVQQSQTEELLEVLGKRQEVLMRVSELEETIRPARGEWMEYLSRLEAEERAKAENLLAETRHLLEQITTADRNDAMVLQQRKLNIGQQINQARSARQVNKTYAAAAYGTRVSRMDVQR